MTLSPLPANKRKRRFAPVGQDAEEEPVSLEDAGN
jgi:hypothetical protein